MTSTITTYSGDEWEEFIQLLLKRHYGPGDYQEVPDKDSGDCGIEGFSTTGHAYQCYAAEEPLDTQELYEKQRNKMSADIKKFITNHAKLSGVLGTVQISRWIFTVPRFDSHRLLQHASTKTAEVLQAKLPYTTPDFKIIVINDDQFAVERASLASPSLIHVPDLSNDPAPASITNWSSSNNQLISNLETKITKLPAINSEEKKNQLRERMIKHFLMGQNALDYLKNNYPDIYERTMNIKKAYELELETEQLINPAPPQVALTSTLTKYKLQLGLELKNINSSTIATLGWESVADWLLRCPLNFP
jgi:hypothetical protein